MPDPADSFASEHWIAALFLDGRQIYPEIASWVDLSSNARSELLADIEAVLDAISAAGLAVVEKEEGR